VSTEDERPDAVGPPESPRPGSAAARAASRARRIGSGSRPVPGRRPSPGLPAQRPGIEPVLPGAEPPRPGIEPVPAGAEPSRSGAEPSRSGVEPDVPVAWRPSPGRAARGSATLPWLAALLAATVALALAVADLLVWHPWHHEQSVAEQRERLLAAVRPAVTRVVSYDYRHFDQDTAAAAASLAEPFRDEYQRSVRTTIRAQALERKSVVKGEVGSVGITAVTDDGKQATVLVLGEQTITNTLQPQGEHDPISVRVTVQLVHGKWLISKIDLV
jgi:Mce-associated membrane protein